MPQYLSTDPNAGKYLSTDPNAGTKVPPAMVAKEPTPPTLLQRLGNIPEVFMVRKLIGLAAEHPVQTGAVLGGLAAAPFTGGASVPAGMAAAGLGAAGGAGLGSIAAAATGKSGPSTPMGVARTMGTEGAMGAMGEGVGRAVGGTLKLLGRGAYRVALSPTQQVLGKYGDVVGEGLETGTPVSRSGLAKAVASKERRMAGKRVALTEAGNRGVTYDADTIANDASAPLATYATKQVRAGLPNPTQDIGEQLGQFRAANPQGSLTPQALDEIKATLDDITGGAHRKMRMREPITAGEKTNVELTRAMGRAQEANIPNYRQMNRSIMDAEGLRRAIERRTLGSGGNQVLDTLLMLMRGSAGVPGRIAMMPPLLSRLGIGAYQTGRVIPTLTRTGALLLPNTPED